jgi:membrane fusion protein, copper/silver efflux system
MKTLFSNKYIRFSFILFGGIFLGWLFFHSADNGSEKLDQTVKTTKTEIWTCSMHPQIHLSYPGKCPICGMDLIPLSQGSVSTDPDAIHMTKEAVELANVLTTVVSKQNPIKDIRLYGKVQADERLMQSQVSYVPGRIEKLLVNFTGEEVHKGQTLALIYSPDLVTTQQELLETAKAKSSQPLLYEAAKEKLRQWKLSENQISSIENSGKVKTDFEVTSLTSGTVSGRRVNTGDYVSAGTILYDIADLSHVWILFDAYESDLPYLSQGQKVSFSIQASPGAEYNGNITFIDPVLDPLTRVAKVRVEINNQAGKLKPEMFATGTVKANLDAYNDKLVIPRSAVLWTGKRSIVYVKQAGVNEIVFKIREIELGPMLGNSYVVENGLIVGEEIVTQGAFNVDASAQLEGKPSMMNPKKENTLAAGISSKENSSDKTIPEAKATNISVANAVFKVSGNCGMCKARIEKAAKSVKGVSEAVWDAKSKKLTLKYDSKLTNSTAIQKVIAIAGHDTPKYKAADTVYDSLPECCKYRK